jgi:hypothetical protein
MAPICGDKVQALTSTECRFSFILSFSLLYLPWDLTVYTSNLIHKTTQFEKIARFPHAYHRNKKFQRGEDRKEWKRKGKEDVKQCSLIN